jgi:hypothetical protein
MDSACVYRALAGVLEERRQPLNAGAAQQDEGSLFRMVNAFGIVIERGPTRRL